MIAGIVLCAIAAAITVAAIIGRIDVSTTVRATRARRKVTIVPKNSFLRPEDPRPEKGPVYAVNTTKSRIVFPQVVNQAGFILDPTPAPGSITQVSIETLNTVEFMRLWAPGKVAVSTSPKVALVYSDLADEAAAAQAKEARKITDAITTRDKSGDLTATRDQHGNIKIEKAEEAVEKTAPKRRKRQAAPADQAQEAPEDGSGENNE